MKVTKEAIEGNAKRNTERYHWLKEHGVCVRCGQRDALPNRTACAECAEKQRQAVAKHYDYERQKEYMRRRRDRLLSQGLCVQCGRRASVEGRNKCPECIEKNRVYQLERSRRIKREMMECQQSQTKQKNVKGNSDESFITGTGSTDSV